MIGKRKYIHASAARVAMRASRPKGLRARLKHFAADERGTNAIEFVIAAPFFLTLMFGMITLLDTQNMTTQGGKVSSTVADIVAQSTLVNREIIDATLNAGEAIMGARASQLQLYVAGININDDGEARVLWARGKNLSSLTLPAIGSIYPLAPALLNNRGFIVTSKARIEHRPLFGSGDDWSYWLGSNRLKAESHTYDYENSYVPREDLITNCSDC
ncbi:MAG: hypothetical protein AAGF28_00540 [Pseudomonadota bacterium]